MAELKPAVIADSLDGLWSEIGRTWVSIRRSFFEAPGTLTVSLWFNCGVPFDRFDQRS